MKRILLLLFITGAVTFTQAQENMVTISGGYAFANLEDLDESATGWRLNGLYEFIPHAGKMSHGLSFGYIGTSADVGEGENASTYKLHTWPIYYAPKYTFGKNKFNAFVKGAFGMHYSGYDRTGALTEVGTFDMGFYGGAGAGIKFLFREKFYIVGEYEWAYLSNSLYRDGFMNSAMGGIGITF